MADHLEPLPRDVRQQVVNDAVLAERRQFVRRMEKYRNDMVVFNTQMKIEILRMKLLQEAGAGKSRGEEGYML